jgi:hypothetical protein
MATSQSDQNYGGGGGSIFGKQILLLAMVVVGGILVYNTFFSGSGGGLGLFGGGGGREVQLTYVPNDFKPSLNEEATLKILSDPAKYRKEFDDMVYNFNLSLLYHVANRMGMPDSLKRRLEPAYKQHHNYLEALYYEDFLALKDSSATLYETWYNDNTNQAVEIFNEVAGKYTCFFVTQVMATLIETEGGRLMARGKKVGTPCAIAINEGLRPMVDRLEKRAAIYDFSASRGLLKEKVRKGIAELATYEIRSRLGIDRKLQYKIFGFAISETNIQVEAISVIKAGFKLDRYFDVTLSPSKNTVFVTLPEPSIVSHEVFPRVDKLDVGYLAGINSEEMNTNFNELRREFRQDALVNEKILEKAKGRADSVMQLLLGPTVRAMGRNYKLEVRYRESPEVLDANERLRRAESPTPVEEPPIKDPQPVEKPKEFIPQ